VRTKQTPVVSGAVSELRLQVRLRDGLRYGLLVFLALRIGLSLAALAATALLPHADTLTPTGTPLPVIPSPVGVPGWPAHLITPGWHNLVTAWERFDGLWFLRIAAHGYANGDGSAAFFPLYPLLIRGVSFALGGHPLAAALLISNGSFAGSLVVLYALTVRETGSVDVARRSVLYLAVFPTSFFFLAPYSESLFLLLVLVMFWYVRQERWGPAALAAAGAALTRNIGVLLVIPLAIEAYQQWRAEGDGLGRRLAWSAAPVLAVIPYLLYWQALSGDWLAPKHQQANWDRTFESPLTTIAKGTHEAWRWIGIYPGGYHLLDWLIVVPVLVAAVYVLVRFRPAYGAFVWASLLPPLFFVFGGRPLMSLPRFALPLFPVFWALARVTKRSRGLQDVLVVGSSVLLGFLLLLFVNWYYIF
jgi:Mannosyltransferase (PIG-V)